MDDKRLEEMARECLSKGLKSHWDRIEPCGKFGEGVEITTDYREVAEAIKSMLRQVQTETEKEFLDMTAWEFEDWRDEYGLKEGEGK